MNLAQNVCLGDFQGDAYFSIKRGFLSFFHLGQFLSNNWSYRVIFGTCEVFVCVEVLWPSQPNGVMSSAVSLPNHTFTGQV